MCYIPDNYDLWEKHDEELQDALELLPLCSICGERIQTEYCYEINDEIICEHCMVGYFRKETMDLMG